MVVGNARRRWLEQSALEVPVAACEAVRPFLGVRIRRATIVVAARASHWDS